jgi:hypothetical protein
MSRRIVTAVTGSWYNLQQEAARQIGQFVDVDCSEHGWKDEVTGKYPVIADSFHVFSRVSKREIGEIVDLNDVEWLKQAAIVDHASPMLFRIHDPKLRIDGGRSYIALEVLTGSDARFYLKSETTELLLAYGKRHWGKIGLGLAITYWWLGR